MPFVCLCGGWAYTRDEMIAANDQRSVDFWLGMLGPFDMFCAEEDDVLVEPWTWRVMGLKLPVHDEDHGLLGDRVAAPWGDVDTGGELIW